MFKKLSRQERFFASQSLLQQLGLAILFNSAIAVLLNLLLQQSQFWNVMLVSQCIGLSIFFSFYLFAHFMELRSWRMLLPLVTGAIIGVLLGVSLSALSYGVKFTALGNIFSEHLDKILVNLFLAFFFGVIVMYFFFSREKQFETAQALQEVQIKNLDHKKRIAETQLQLLQAQIEPHFLFNTLANVISLIDQDSTRARQMLESLTAYLRSSLTRSHDRDGRLRDEIELIENYLQIIQIRMQDRLQYKIEIDEGLLDIPFPILLLQPLVENAIKHGLEPQAKGGEVSIKASKHGDMLKICVIDNGKGLGSGNLSGFGLLNVRQRLRSLHGDAASFTLGEIRAGGVQACIEVPYA